MAENSIFLTTEQVSNLLGVHVRTVQRLTKKGKLKGIRIGKLWKYEKAAISDFISSGRQINPLERRAYPRINSNFNCRYSVNLPPFRNITSKGIIINISAGGILLYTNSTDNKEVDKVDINDPIDMIFEMNLKPNYLESVYALGKVVRRTDSCIGIKFKNIDKKIQGRIKKYAE